MGSSNLSLSTQWIASKVKFDTKPDTPIKQKGWGLIKIVNSQWWFVARYKIFCVNCQIDLQLSCRSQLERALSGRRRAPATTAARRSWQGHWCWAPGPPSLTIQYTWEKLDNDLLCQSCVTHITTQTYKTVLAVHSSLQAFSQTGVSAKEGNPSLPPRQPSYIWGITSVRPLIWRPPILKGDILL